MGKKIQNNNRKEDEKKNDRFGSLKRKREGNYYPRNEPRNDSRKNDKKNDRNQNRGNYHKEGDDDRGRDRDRGSSFKSGFNNREKGNYSGNMNNKDRGGNNRNDRRDSRNERKYNSREEDPKEERRNNSRDRRDEDRGRGRGREKENYYDKNKEKRNYDDDKRKDDHYRREEKSGHRNDFHKDGKNRPRDFLRNKVRSSGRGRGNAKRNFNNNRKKVYRKGALQQLDISQKTSKLLFDPIFLGGRIFSDALFIYAEANKIFQRYIDGEPLKDKDNEFMMDLLKYHHNYDAKAKNIDYITIGKSPEHKICRCFYIVRKNKEKIDFSYRKCIDNIRRLDRIKKKSEYTKTIK